MGWFVFLRWLCLGTRGIFENCCLTSLGKPCWSTGLFAAGSAMLRLWHSLGLFRWLVSVGVKARVQRTGFRDVLARSRRAMKRRSKSKRARARRRERATQTRLVLNCPILDPPTGGWSNQSVRMGRSHAHVHGFWGHAYVI